jgi:bifunctional non-homologous end joining protein LigD
VAEVPAAVCDTHALLFHAGGGDRLGRRAAAHFDALTNLDKPFWPELGITKGDLMQYYADVAPLLLPHIRGSRDGDEALSRTARAGEFFFMKRAPSPRPEWIRPAASITTRATSSTFPVIDDLPSLLWVINLGCIDLNQWYAKCDDVDRPDYLHFDLDPGRGDVGEQVLETAHRARRARDAEDAVAGEDDRLEGAARLRADRARAVQKDVWTFAKALAVELAARIRS